MTQYDISQMGIRIIIDSNYYEPTPGTPTQVEGTVLSLMTHGRTGEEMYNKGQILDLLCNYDYEGAADGLVRFDNDVKHWLVGGTMILRSTKGSRLKSIWPGNDNLQYDDTPFHELKPITKRPPPIKWKHTVGTFIEPPVYNDFLSMPQDGGRYKAVYQGVICLARFMPHNNAYEYHEEVPGAPICVVGMDELLVQQTTTIDTTVDGTIHFTTPDGQMHLVKTGTLRTIADTNPNNAIDIPQPHQYLWATSTTNTAEEPLAPPLVYGEDEIPY